MLPTLIFGFLNREGPMLISLMAGFICAAFINIEKFHSFKAGQIEAKIKQTEELIEDVNASISQLKKMNEPLMNYTLAHIVRGNRVMGVDAFDKEALFDRLDTNINEFHIKDQYTLNLLEEARNAIGKSYLFEIELAVEKVVNSTNTPFAQRISYYSDEFTLPSSLKVREFFNQNPALYNEKINEKVNDYEMFVNRKWGKPHVS